LHILLDTNLWRYVMDADAVPQLRNAARKSPHQIVIAPGVVYQALRTGDRVLREKMIRSMASPDWVRLMPEAYSEAMALRGEVIRVRPQWRRSRADLVMFQRLEAPGSFLPCITNQETHRIRQRQRNRHARHRLVHFSVSGANRAGQIFAAFRRACFRPVRM